MSTALTNAEHQVSEWKKYGPTGYDYNHEYVRVRLADEGPKVLHPLIEHTKGLEYWIGRLQGCTCHVDGPDGIECPPCELKKRVSQ
jgi:hypothetical protein